MILDCRSLIISSIGIEGIIGGAQAKGKWNFVVRHTYLLRWVYGDVFSIMGRCKLLEFLIMIYMIKCL